MLVDLPDLGGLAAIIFALSWFILSNTPGSMKALDFSLAFPNEQAILNIVQLCPFQFAEGLLDVLQCFTPPTIEFFKSLPLIAGKWWAVYLLVLEKTGGQAKIYIGSGRSFDKGYLKRIETYNKVSEGDDRDDHDTIPHYVEDALRKGFTITHKATLAWTPIPLTSEKSAFTGLVLLIETSFCLCF